MCDKAAVQEIVSAYEIMILGIDTYFDTCYRNMNNVCTIPGRMLSEGAEQIMRGSDGTMTPIGYLCAVNDIKFSEDFIIQISKPLSHDPR